MRRWILIVAVPVVILLVLLVLFTTQFRLSSLQGPGAVETYLATAAKRWFVKRGARSVELPVAVDEGESVARGQAIYGSSCSFCHGIGGRRPIDVGLWMSPRAPELDRSLLGESTDAELFWIIKNGVRMTGMPGFDEILSDDEIGDLVRYLRSVGRSPDG